MCGKHAIATLDRYNPPCGPCVLCGHCDKRHRLWDAILDSPEENVEVARNFNISLDHVRAVRAVRPYRCEDWQSHKGPGDAVL